MHDTQGFDTASDGKLRATSWPNILTYARLVAVPALVICFYLTGSAGRWLAHDRDPVGVLLVGEGHPGCADRSRQPVPVLRHGLRVVTHMPAEIQAVVGTRAHPAVPGGDHGGHTAAVEGERVQRHVGVHPPTLTAALWCHEAGRRDSGRVCGVTGACQGGHRC